MGWLSAMALGYSDLEVVPDTQKQIAYDPTLPEAIAQEKVHFYELSSAPRDKDTPPATQRKRICGLRPRVFWPVLVAMLIIVVAGAVVGGVLGSGVLSKGNDSSSSSPTTSSESPAAKSSSSGNGDPKSTVSGKATSTEPLPVTLTTSTEVGPTQTLFRDCPSSNYTIYEALGSPKNQFRKLCQRSFHGGPIDFVNEPTSSLNDCIDLCATYNKEKASAIASSRSELCNSVCWRHNINDPDWPGQCFGGFTQNSSTTGFSIEHEVICDSAAWINQVVPVPN